MRERRKKKANGTPADERNEVGRWTEKNTSITKSNFYFEKKIRVKTRLFNNKKRYPSSL